jgi:amino acid permease
MGCKISYSKSDVIDGVEEETSVSTSEKQRNDVEVKGSSDEQQGSYGNTKRGLKVQHIRLIAIGGESGTGLFAVMGSTLSLVGPARLFMGKESCAFRTVDPCMD